MWTTPYTLVFLSLNSFKQVIVQCVSLTLLPVPKLRKVKLCPQTNCFCSCEQFTEAYLSTFTEVSSSEV